MQRGKPWRGNCSIGYEGFTLGCGSRFFQQQVSSCFGKMGKKSTVEEGHYRRAGGRAKNVIYRVRVGHDERLFMHGKRWVRRSLGPACRASTKNQSEFDEEKAHFGPITRACGSLDSCEYY